MSLFKGFTPEELRALTPWQIPVMGEEDSAPIQEPTVVEQEIETPRFPTAEEIEAIQKQAYEEAAASGYHQGHEEGLQKGYQEGYPEGLSKGYQEGFDQGSQEGRDRGYQEGREQGYQEGQDQGYREGYEAGFLAGQNEGREAMQLVKSRFEQLLSCLDEPLTRVDEQVEEELLALVIAISKQLIRRELHTDPGEIIAVVREALSILPASSRRIAVSLHPDDVELVRSTLALDEHQPRWKILPDESLTRGGCRVTTETSYIDATVEKRLSTVIARLLGGEREADY
jgi:flagellar assembly protein FliH